MYTSVVLAVLPVVSDGEELFKAELSHVTLSVHHCVDVDQDVAIVDNVVHQMYH